MRAKFSFLFMLCMVFVSIKSFAISVDLLRLRDYGNQKIKKLIGDNYNIDGVYFRDGAAAHDKPEAYDLASVFVIATIKDKSLGNYKVAYVASLNGRSEVLLATVKKQPAEKYLVDFVTPLEGTGTFPPETSVPEMVSAVTQLKLANKDTKFELLTFVGSVNFQAPSPQRALEVLTALSQMGAPGSLNGFMYRTPLQLEPVIFLGTGLESKVIDLEEIRTFTAELKKKGTRFTTEPRLPKELIDNCDSLSGEKLNALIKDKYLHISKDALGDIYITTSSGGPGGIAPRSLFYGNGNELNLVPTQGRTETNGMYEIFFDTKPDGNLISVLPLFDDEDPSKHVALYCNLGPDATEHLVTPVDPEIYKNDLETGKIKLCTNSTANPCANKVKQAQ